MYARVRFPLADIFPMAYSLSLHEGSLARFYTES